MTYEPKGASPNQPCWHTALIMKATSQVMVYYMWYGMGETWIQSFFIYGARWGNTSCTWYRSLNGFRFNSSMIFGLWTFCPCLLKRLVKTSKIMKRWLLKQIAISSNGRRKKQLLKLVNALSCPENVSQLLWEGSDHKVTSSLIHTWVFCQLVKSTNTTHI